MRRRLLTVDFSLVLVITSRLEKKTSAKSVNTSTIDQTTTTHNNEESYGTNSLGTYGEDSVITGPGTVGGNLFRDKPWNVLLPDLHDFYVRLSVCSPADYIDGKNMQTFL